jgi:dolichol-phosphate mannosyltransferase
METELKGLSIIIPTLNEGENIEPLLTRITAAIRNNNLQDTEIIFVDDRSTDTTHRQIKKWQAKHPVKLIVRSGRIKGLASAVIEGARTAQYDHVLVMDADLSHPPEMIAELLSPIASGKYDHVIGSRYIKGGGTPDWPIKRRIVSRVATLFAWPFIDVKDPMAGFFCVRKKFLAGLSEDTPGYKVGFELLVQNPSLRTFEVPIIFRDREMGKSKLGSDVMRDFLRQLMKVTGGNFSMANNSKFIRIGLLGMWIDLVLFYLLNMFGTTLGTAHCISFTAATVTVFLLLRQRLILADTDNRSPGKGSLFLFIALFALLLRGGLLASLDEILQWPAQIAILPTIGVSALICYLGCSFWVFPQNGARTTDRQWRLFTLVAVSYIMLLRILYSGPMELMQQEAYYWNYAQHLDIGYLDHPPMVAWLIWLGTLFWGNSEFGVRFAATLCWLAAAIFIYNLARNLFDKSTAMLTLLLLAALPYFFGMGLIMIPDTPLIACWAGALFFLERALLANKRKAWLGAGVCVGLGMLSKYTIALLGPAALLFLLIDRNSRKWLAKPEPYIALFLASLIFSPVLFWNYFHDWASFNFHGSTRWENAYEFSLHGLLGNVLILLTPTGFAAALLLLLPKGQQKAYEHTIQIFTQNKKLFAFAFSFFPLAVFIFFSLSKESKLNWTGPIWLVLLPFIAYHIVNHYKEFSKFRVHKVILRTWPGTIIIAMLIYGVFLHYIVLGFPGIGYPENFHLIGWRDLGAQVGKIESEQQAALEEEPLVVGMDKYRIASQLAFYRPAGDNDKPAKANRKEVVARTSGRHLFGWEGLMYRFWLPRKELTDRTMILVSHYTDYLSHPDVLAHFKSYDDIQELAISKNGREFGRYYYRVAGKYDPMGTQQGIHKD